MSQTVCINNYEYNGHVYSPAFSEPPSPSASDFNSEAEDLHETSSSPPPVTALLPPTPLASSSPTTAPQSQQRSRHCKKRSRTAEAASPHVNKKPRFPTKYHELLQPMEPITTMPVTTIRPTHRASYVEEAQADFHALLRKCLRNSSGGVGELEDFIKLNRDRIDVDQYVGDSGQTPLHLSCMEGSVECAKLLVRFGANWRLTTRDGFSSMHIAAFSGSSDLMIYVMSLK